MIQEPSGGSSKATKGEKPLDLNKLLNTLRDKIKKIHVANKVGSGEIESKPTL